MLKFREYFLERILTILLTQQRIEEKLGSSEVEKILAAHIGRRRVEPRRL